MPLARSALQGHQFNDAPEQGAAEGEQRMSEGLANDGHGDARWMGDFTITTECERLLTAR